MRRSSHAIGDVIEIATGRGLAYAQVTHDVSQWGSLLRVVRGFHPQRPGDVPSLAGMPTVMWQFFPLRQALRAGIVAVAGHADVPEDARKLPLFRAPGMVLRSGEVRNWWLWDGQREWPARTLTDELAQLPIRGVVNDTELIRRIEALDAQDPAPREA